MTSSNSRRCPLLTSLLDPSFGIPMDVTFKIMGRHTDDVQEDVLLGEVKGHKIILGLYSPVFKGGFFGAAKDKEEVIVVKQTSLESFQRMFDYIYEKDIEDWVNLNVLELYDIANLAEKYNIPDLTEVIKNMMEKVPLTMDNVVEIADTAVQFHQFPDISNSLLMNCAQLIKKNLRTAVRILEFAAEKSGSGRDSAVLRIIKMVVDLECINCKEDECKNGQEVRVGKVGVGTVVMVNRSSWGYWGSNGGSFAGQVFTVLSVTGPNHLMVKDQTGKEDQYAFGYNNGIKNFVFKCA